jgi:hypothetical protein
LSFVQAARKYVQFVDGILRLQCLGFRRRRDRSQCIRDPITIRLRLERASADISSKYAQAVPRAMFSIM